MAHPLRMLRWHYVGRITLALGIFAGAVVAWFDTPGSTTLLATLMLLLSLGVTFGALWYTYGLGRHPGKRFLYGQVFFDTVLVTAVVHVTSVGGSSIFAPLYILVIAAGALLLPLPGGVMIGALASLLYFADLVWGHPQPLGGMISILGLQVPAQWGLTLLQIAVFAIIALATGALGDRLRKTGSALGAVQLELRQLRLDTNDILGAIDTGLVTVDDQGRLVYMNGAAEHVVGLPARDFRDKEVTEELDRRAPGLGALIRRTSTHRQPIRRFEIRLPSQNGGRERYLGVRTTVLERSHSPWVTAVFQDITDSRQIEELSRRAERLQAIAELGASLAHEIKNPLASIRSAVEQLATTRLTDRDRDKLRDLVINGSDRLTRLLADFMEFSRIEARRWGPVDLCKVARDAINLVQQHPDASRRAQFQTRLPRAPLFVAGDEDLLHRAVFNLVLNAVQHTGDDGKVGVELNRVARREMPGGVPLEEPIRLIVRDTGKGIAPEAVARIFDPFFTTREGGTGLGLALVHRAVEAHQGLILVDRAHPHGAQFTVYLPAQAERRV